MSDFENRIHDGIKPNINSDENEILNTRDVNRSPNRPGTYSLLQLMIFLFVLSWIVLDLICTNVIA